MIEAVERYAAIETPLLDERHARLIAVRLDRQKLETALVQPKVWAAFGKHSLWPQAFDEFQVDRGTEVLMRVVAERISKPVLEGAAGVRRTPEEQLAVGCAPETLVAKETAELRLPLTARLAAAKFALEVVLAGLFGVGTVPLPVFGVRPRVQAEPHELGRPLIAGVQRAVEHEVVRPLQFRKPLLSRPHLHDEIAGRDCADPRATGHRRRSSSLRIAKRSRTPTAPLRARSFVSEMGRWPLLCRLPAPAQGALPGPL